MTILIDLPTEVEAKVKTQASADGLAVEDYLSSMIADAADRREILRNGSEKSFAEILEPIQRGFQESGKSDDEILDFFEEVREEIWREKQSSK